jgi:hypothetical protein
MTTGKKLLGLSVAMVVLLGLALVLPCLLPGRMSKGGILGAQVLRAINLSETMYSTTYKKMGYAPNLAVFGPANEGKCSAERACLLNSVLACAEGMGQGWCEKYDYRFNVQSSSTSAPYLDYWATATPIRPNSGLKTYCTTMDAVIRSEQITPLSRPYTLDECKALKPED